MKKLFIATILLTMATITSAQDFRFDEVTYTPAATTFKLFAPRDAKAVAVEYNACPDAAKAKKWKTVKMKCGDNGIWTATVGHDLNHYAYRFCVDGRQSVGVFAKVVGANSAWGYVIDMKETDPEGWERDVRPAIQSPSDLVIYELHHRDFSIDMSSGLKHKGKFLALTEPKAIAHLKELGVNAVHILPSFDFASVDETSNRPQYNWGYDPVNYNVPEGSYSSDPTDPAVRIREFKEMVQALHKAGIRIVLDVVYNHTFDIKNSNFQKTFPDYFYRKTADGTYSDGSGCGNETASEQPMMRRFMTESVKYWIEEYHIDGFRFDLMGCHDIETMNAIRKMVDSIDPTIFIYGEGWSAGACSLPAERLGMKANMAKMPGIAAFSDELRDALRGPFSDDTKGGFLVGEPDGEESMKFGIAGCIEHPQVDMKRVNYSKEAWAVEPTQMISYVSCHDDMCLTDRLHASMPAGKNKRIATEELIRLDLLAQTAVFTSQGVPFMLSGEEMLRNKKGVHNSYNSPDSINHLDWNNLKRYPQVFDYYKALIALRKAHPAFRLGKADLVRRHLEFLNAPSLSVAFRLKQHAGGDAWDDIIVVLNANRTKQDISIPDGSYTVVCANGTIRPEGLYTVSGSTVSVAPQSALILHN